MLGIKAFDQAYHIDFWMPFIFVFMSIFYVKRAELGILKFGQAFLSGVYTAGVFTILASLLVYFHIKVLDNDFFVESAKSGAATLLSNIDDNMEKEDVRMIKESADYLLNTTEEIYTLDKAVKLLGPSFVFILILSVLFRRSNASKS